jgi:cytochrome c oxidase subunit 2
MKVVVDTPEDFKKWIATQKTLAAKIKEEKAGAAGNETNGATPAGTETPAKGSDTIAAVKPDAPAVAAK